MKKFNAFILIIISLLLTNCSRSSLIGKYKNVIPNGGDLEFTADNRFVKSFEGKPYFTGTYRTDASQAPKRLVITDYGKYGTAPAEENAGRTIPVLAIYKLQGNRLTIKIMNGTDANATYPKDFSDDPAFLIAQYDAE